MLWMLHLVNWTSWTKISRLKLNSVVLKLTFSVLWVCTLLRCIISFYLTSRLEDFKTIFIQNFMLSAKTWFWCDNRHWDFVSICLRRRLNEVTKFTCGLRIRAFQILLKIVKFPAFDFRFAKRQWLKFEQIHRYYPIGICIETTWWDGVCYCQLFHRQKDVAANVCDRIISSSSHSISFWTVWGSEIVWCLSEWLLLRECWRHKIPQVSQLWYSKFSEKNGKLKLETCGRIQGSKGHL